MTSFADFTTMGVGSPIAHFIETDHARGAHRSRGGCRFQRPALGRRRWRLQPACSVSLDGVVVRDARRLITVPDGLHR